MHGSMMTKNDVSPKFERGDSQISYGPKCKVENIKGAGYLFKRSDWHEDGSISIYYGVELTESQYKELMGLKRD